MDGLCFRHYCESNATSESAMYVSMMCNPGYFCPAGLSSMTEATDCSHGHYCPEGNRYTNISW